MIYALDLVKEVTESMNIIDNGLLYENLINLW